MLSLVYKSDFKRSQSDASRLALEHKNIVYNDLFTVVFHYQMLYLYLLLNRGYELSPEAFIKSNSEGQRDGKREEKRK